MFSALERFVSAVVGNENLEVHLDTVGFVKLSHTGRVRDADKKIERASELLEVQRRKCSDLQRRIAHEDQLALRKRDIIKRKGANTSIGKKALFEAKQHLNRRAVLERELRGKRAIMERVTRTINSSQRALGGDGDAELLRLTAELGEVAIGDGDPVAELDGITERVLESGQTLAEVEDAFARAGDQFANESELEGDAAQRDNENAYGTADDVMSALDDLAEEAEVNAQTEYEMPPSGAYASTSSSSRQYSSLNINLPTAPADSPQSSTQPRAWALMDMDGGSARPRSQYHSAHAFGDDHL